MLWNEPNNLSHWDRSQDPDWALFTEMIAMAGERLGQVAPGLTRVLGGISPIDPLFIRNVFGRDIADAIDQAFGRAYTLDGVGVVAELAQVGDDPVLDGLQACCNRIVDGDIVAGARKDLSEAVPHEAGPDHRNARHVGHRSTRRVAAVGVEDMPGVEVGSTRGEEEQRTREVGGLAEPAFRHARQKALAYLACAVGVLVHPCG